MIKHRKDYEQEFHRYCSSWRHAVQIGKKMYFVNIFVHPQFIKDWWHMWKGDRVKALWCYIKHPIEYWWTLGK